eukprot:SAG31_NODE_1761_length_7326_cov_2.101148_2_plen_305_part_00
MVAQIVRTDKAVDDCCLPLLASLWGIMHSRYDWIAEAVFALEASAPEVVARMLQQSEHANPGILNADGQVVSARSGSLSWDPTGRRDKITPAYDRPTNRPESAKAFLISQADLQYWNSQPFCADVPTGILEYLAADPTTILANRFRHYARHCLLPHMQRVQQLLDAYGSLVQPPPVAFLQSKFPHCFWHFNRPTMFREIWDGRKRLWEALLAEWEGGEIGRIVPSGVGPCMNVLRSHKNPSTDVRVALSCYSNMIKGAIPMAGMLAINDWAIANGQERQRELIGCETLLFVFFLRVFVSSNQQH